MSTGSRSSLSIWASPPDLKKQPLPDMTQADALRLAINVLRDAAESRKMPSGMALDEVTVEMHADAAEMLEASLAALRDHE